MGRGRSAATIILERACVDILREIHPASVRAVAYQLFNRKLLPDMSTASTQKVSRILTAARKTGVIPWAWVVDETRALEHRPSWASPAAYVATVATSYRRDRWEQQRTRVEVWSEKGTVRGVLKPVLDDYGVGFRVMHGFGSVTVIHDVAEMSDSLDEPLQVLYVGDYDPSGLYMSEEDLPRRLNEEDASVDVHRIALLPSDLDDLTLHKALFPAATKKSDSRHTWFARHHGDWCLELDGLSPVMLRHRVEDAIARCIDWKMWSHDEALERVQLDSLNQVLQGWSSLTSDSRAL
jgi:hypothetical protein